MQTFEKYFFYDAYFNLFIGKKFRKIYARIQPTLNDIQNRAYRKAILVFP